jgi:hypothetical protein
MKKAVLYARVSSDTQQKEAEIFDNLFSLARRRLVKRPLAIPPQPFVFRSLLSDCL